MLTIATTRAVAQWCIDNFPSNFIFQPDLLGGWKQFRLIKGCRGYGKPKALKALTGCKTEDDYKQVTLQVYQSVFGEDAEEKMNLNYRLVKLLGSAREYEDAISQG